MFVVEIGAVITTVTWLIQVFGGKALGGHDPAWYTLVISIWLWLTDVFADLAEAFAEGRAGPGGTRSRDSRGTVGDDEGRTTKQAVEVARGHVVVVDAGELIPATEP